MTIVSAVLLATILAFAGSALADMPAPLPQSPTAVTPPAGAPDPSADPIAGGPASLVPVPAVPPASEQPVGSFLLKQVRAKIVLYRKSAWRWQNLLGLRKSSGGNIWNIGSLQNGQKMLDTWQGRSRKLHQAAKGWMRQRITRFHQDIQHMSAVMGVNPVRSLSSTGNLEAQFLHARKAWRQVRQKFSNPPGMGNFICIHGHEGAWNANTGNGYYGGVQMDYSFMRSYGGYLLRTKGTANNWTPLEQIWVASKALPSRGFNPWPNTARMCGLL